MSVDASAGDDKLEDRQGENYVRLLNLLAVGQIAMFLSTAIWLPPYRFPQVPLFAILRDVPVWLEVAAFLGSLAGTFFARRPASRAARRIRHAVCAVSFAVLFCLNQHRLQPWAYQFFILHAWLSLSSPRWMLTGWRWLTISIYVYSAVSKLDYSFCTQHGPFLLDGFLHVFGLENGTTHWPATARFFVAGLMPASELLAAICLCFRRTQRLGLWLSLLMHLFLIMALGPWGHDHSVGVLLWNGFFIVQNWFLFRNPQPDIVPGESPGAKTREGLAWLFLAFVLLAPVGEPFGLWDHWPSWAVYAARPARTTIFIHEDELELIPAEMRNYVQPPAPLEPWHRFRVDRWSLDAAKVPISPQDRFQIGVALAVAKRCQLTTLKIAIDGPPNRWTGRRTHQEFIGLDAIHELAAGYRLNALPR